MSDYLPLLGFKAAGRESTTDSDARDALEAALDVALRAAADKSTDRTATRLLSGKSRKGTRHFVPEYAVDTRVGVKALDTARMVDPERWADEAEAAIEDLVLAAALAAAADLADGLGWEITEAKAGFVPPALARRAVDRVVLDIKRFVRDSARARGEALSAALNAADQAGQAMADLSAIVTDTMQRNATWAASIARQAATATIEGARDGLAQQAAAALTESGRPDPGVTSQWVSRLDEKVRESHRKAHGQKRAPGAPFLVGGALLDYPGDPAGPPSETRNCRCKTVYRSTITGRFVAAATVTR